MEMPFHPMDERRVLVCKWLIERLLLFCSSWLLLRAVRQKARGQGFRAVWEALRRAWTARAEGAENVKKIRIFAPSDGRGGCKAGSCERKRMGKSEFLGKKPYFCYVADRSGRRLVPVACGRRRLSPRATRCGGEKQETNGEKTVVPVLPVRPHARAGGCHGRRRRFEALRAGHRRRSRRPRRGRRGCLFQGKKHQPERGAGLWPAGGGQLPRRARGLHAKARRLRALAAPRRHCQRQPRRPVHLHPHQRPAQGAHCLRRRDLYPRYGPRQGQPRSGQARERRHRLRGEL